MGHCRGSLNGVPEKGAKIKMIDHNRFVLVSPCYTGGGVYIFTGKLANGNFFLASNDMHDIRELSEDPDKYDFNDILQAEWQERHLIKDYDCESEETRQFFTDMYSWILHNKPSGNYCMSEMISEFIAV